MSEETTVVADDDKYVKFGTMKKMFESFYELMPKSYQSINITFDAGEGGLFDDGQQTLATTGYSGQKLKLPELSPSRTGYTFAGWFTQDGTAVDGAVKNGTEDITYYAHWTANTYHVILVQNDGTGNEGILPVAYGELFSLAAMPTRTGYTALGYFDSQNDGEGVKYINADGSGAKAFDKTETVILYVHWKANTYTVSLNGNYSGASTSTISVTYGSMPENIQIPERVGYWFMGYSSDPSVISDDTKYFDNTGAATKIWSIDDQDVVLYAIWSVKEIQIALNSGYPGGGDSQYITITFGSTNSTVEIPERDGYTFLGYYDAENEGGTQWFDGNGALVKPWDIDSTTYLYAHWEIITIGVTLDGNYDGAMASQFFIVPGSTPENIEIPVRDGYNFLGYYSTATDGTQYFTNEGVATDVWSSVISAIVLYAHWEESAPALPVYDELTGRYTNESIEAWMNSYADGLVYGVKIPLYSANTGTEATKTDANAGLVLEPSTNSVVGRNDYVGKKLFMCTRVNGGADADGMPYVTAIEGMDERFNCKTENTFALTPVYYNKYTIDSSAILQQYSDTKLDGFNACAGAYLPDGTTKRPYILRACYMDSDGQFTSKSGTLPAAKTSENAEGYYQHTFMNDVNCSINRSDGLSYLSYGDVDYQIEFMQLMLGVKAPKSKAKGAIGNLTSYKVSGATSGKTVRLSSANASNFKVGSYVNIGSSDSELSANNWSIAQGVKIIGIMTSGADKILTLDIPGTINVTTNDYVTFSRYRNGSCDNVKGTYGCFDSAGMTDGKTPFRFQNIEYCLGIREIVTNMLLFNTKLYIAPNIKRCTGLGTNNGWVNAYVAAAPTGTFYIGDYFSICGAKIPKAVTNNSVTANTGYMTEFSYTSNGAYQGVSVGGTKGNPTNDGVGAFHAVAASTGNYNFGTRVSTIGKSSKASYLCRK